MTKKRVRRKAINPVSEPAIPMAQCPHCYSHIDARASHCPNCGKAVKTASGQYQTGQLLMALGLLIAIVGIFTEPVVLIGGLVTMGAGAMARMTA